MLSFTYPLYDFGFMHLSIKGIQKEKKKYNLENGKAEKPKRKDLFSWNLQVSKVCALA